MGVATVAVYSDADAGEPARGRGRPRGPAARRGPGRHLPPPGPAVGRRPSQRRRRRPPGLRVPVRVGGVRPGRRGSRPRLGGAAARGHRRHGVEDRLQAADGGGRGADAAQHHRRRCDTSRSRRGGPTGLAPARQGVGGRRRPRHAHRGGARRAGRGLGRRPPRGRVRLRRRDGVPGALRDGAPPHRGPGAGRRPRRHRRPLRARVQHPAAPPEDHRGGAVPRGGAGTAGPALRGRRDRRRGPSATSTPAPSSSSSTPAGSTDPATGSPTSWR